MQENCGTIETAENVLFDRENLEKSKLFHSSSTPSELFVKKGCKICQSDPKIRCFIEDESRRGVILADIVEELKQEYNFEISESSISRHMKHLRAYLARAGGDRFQRKMLESYGQQIEDLSDVQGQMQIILKAMGTRFLQTLDKKEIDTKDLLSIARFLEIELKTGDGVTEKVDDIDDMLAKMALENSQSSLGFDSE